jgi:8-oxo-dGTP pyrophosphatase MutT (NUDIX family)
MACDHVTCDHVFIFFLVIKLTQAGLRELHEETGLHITEGECQGQQLTPLALWEVRKTPQRFFRKYAMIN